MSTKKTPVLVIEDDPIINEFINYLSKDCENIDLIIATTKQMALNLLKSREDFEYVFVDWHLPDGTSEALIDLIYETQKNISNIYATSSCDDSRRKQVLNEGATEECTKQHIPTKIFELDEKLAIVN